MPEINIPPGVVKTLSGAAAVGRFIDMDKVRFKNGKAEKIGGWTKLNDTPVEGIPRSMHAYISPAKLEVKAVGTERGLFIYDWDEELSDITPLRVEDAALGTNPFAYTSDGVTVTVTVTHVAHGAIIGDSATFSGGVFNGGNEVTGEFTITSIVDNDHYTVEMTQAPDAHFANVSLLLHCNGSDAGTTFTDHSSIGHTVTAVGNAQLDTAQKKFGTASGLFDGNGDALTVPDHASFEFGTGAFTLEAWVRFNSLPSNGNSATIIAKGAASGGVSPVNFHILNTAGIYSIRAVLSNQNAPGNTVIVSGNLASLLTNTWYHLAACRSGSTLRLFVDGALIASSTNSTAIFDNAIALSVGAHFESPSTYTSPLDGWIDEVRITKAARYTAAFTAPAAAFFQASDGGAAVLVDYEISVGITNPAEDVGYGIGPYGADLYGTPRATSDLIVEPRFWSLTNYGNLLLASYQEGTIYTWNQDTQDRAEPLAGAPSDCIYVFLTPERFIFALRAGMVLSWPDRDDPTDWTPTAVNQANSRTLGTGSRLIVGCALSGVSLIWSDTAVYSAQFIGGDSIYTTDLIGINCGIVGPGAFCTETGTAYWLGSSSFHMYAGSIGAIPRQAEVLAWVLANLDPGMRSKVTSWFDPVNREAWFCFPGRDNGAGENNLYAMVQVDTFDWAHGTLERSAATLRVAKDRNPILASPDGYLYDHENDQLDKNADGAAMPWHLETGLWRIPDAKQSVDIFGFSPDFERQVGAIELQVTAKDRPQSSNEDGEAGTLEEDTETKDLRVEGRYFQYRLSQNVVDGDFREGVHNLDVQGAGYRR